MSFGDLAKNEVAGSTTAEIAPHCTPACGSLPTTSWNLSAWPSMASPTGPKNLCGLHAWRPHPPLAFATLPQLHPLRHRRVPAVRYVPATAEEAVTTVVTAVAIVVVLLGMVALAVLGIREADQHLKRDHSRLTPWAIARAAAGGVGMLAFVLAGADAWHGLIRRRLDHVRHILGKRWHLRRCSGSAVRS